MTPDDPRHGSWRGYCAHRYAGEKACEACLRAAARYDATLRLERLRGMPSRRIPAVGVARRVQALVALGWSFQQIAARIGVDHGLPCRWARSTGWVTRSTQERVGRLFEELCMTPPPQDTPRLRREATYARTVARKHGWLPPLAWDDIDNPDEQPTLGTPDVDDPEAVDPAVVLRILSGEWRLPATNAERRAVVAKWTGELNDLARLTGWRVHRYTQPRHEGTAA